LDIGTTEGMLQGGNIMRRHLVFAGLTCLMMSLVVGGTANAQLHPGSIVVWGLDTICNILTCPPAPNTQLVAVAGGDDWFALALRADGSIAPWGCYRCGMWDVPQPNASFKAVAAGASFALGLKSYGSIVAWGCNDHGERNVPEPNSDFSAIAAGWCHGLGLKADGSIVAWGCNDSHQCEVPEQNSDFVAVAAGGYHSLGIKADGSIVAWGCNDSHQCEVPAPNSDFVAVAAGAAHSLGLKSDGSIVAWGDNSFCQCDVPGCNFEYVAVAAGWRHSLGLRADGSIAAWGLNDCGQCEVPAPNKGFTAIAGGAHYSLGIGNTTPHITLMDCCPSGPDNTAYRFQVTAGGDPVNGIDLCMIAVDGNPVEVVGCLTPPEEYGVWTCGVTSGDCVSFETEGDPIAAGYGHYPFTILVDWPECSQHLTVQWTFKYNGQVVAGPDTTEFHYGYSSVVPTTWGSIKAMYK
jgi:hypothetical protein